MRILFLGTPEFAAYSLEKICQAGYDVVGVVTMPDKRAGRGHKLLQSPVKECALRHNLPVLQPTNLKDEAFLAELRALNADLFVVIAFRMLPRAVWEMPRLGTFNLHASLLPKYRGAAPINRAVMAGETVTGVTTFFLRHEIDTGDIIDQREITIAEDEDTGSVHDRLMVLGADMVLSTLADICKYGADVPRRPQPEGDFIPAPKIFTEDCLIDWNRSARDVHNHIRGLSPYPAAFTMVQTPDGEPLKLKVFKGKIRADVALNPGDVLIEKERLSVGTSDGAYELLEVQLQGKRHMTTAEFLRGFNNFQILPTLPCKSK